jgi:hypothetical protein
MIMLTQWLDSWSAFYSNHAMMRTMVEFVHIGGLVAGGGCAIAADLATISATRQTAAARGTQLQLLGRTHAIVVVGMVALSASGVLLFAADAETFLYSRVFWLKMGLMVMLLGNGWLLMRAERAAHREGASAWRRLHLTAISSLVLWFLTTLVGASLPNLG